MSCIRYCRNGLRGTQCSAQRPNQSACNLHCNDVGMFPVLKLWEVVPNQSCSWDFCPCLKRCFWIPSATGQHPTKIVIQLQVSMARRWGNLFHTKVSPLPCAHNSPGTVVEMQILIPQVSRGPEDPASLTSSLVGLMPLVLDVEPRMRAKLWSFVRRNLS